MSLRKNITARAAHAAHEIQLTSILVGAVLQTAATDARCALAWARYGCVLVLEQPRLFRAELERVRAFCGL